MSPVLGTGSQVGLPIMNYFLFVLVTDCCTPPLVNVFDFPRAASLCASSCCLLLVFKIEATGFYFYRFSFARTAQTLIGRLPAALWVTTARAVAEKVG
jgi:hypothetical protein